MYIKILYYFYLFKTCVLTVFVVQGVVRTIYAGIKIKPHDVVEVGISTAFGFLLPVMSQAVLSATARIFLLKIFNIIALIGMIIVCLSLILDPDIKVILQSSNLIGFYVGCLVVSPRES